MGSSCRGTAGDEFIGLHSPKRLYAQRHFEIRSITSIVSSSGRDPRRYTSMQLDAGKYLFCASSSEQPDASSTSERRSTANCRLRIGFTGPDLPVNPNSVCAGLAPL